MLHLLASINAEQLAGHWSLMHLRIAFAHLELLSEEAEQLIKASGTQTRYSRNAIVLILTLFAPFFLTA